MLKEGFSGKSIQDSTYLTALQHDDDQEVPRFKAEPLLYEALDPKSDLVRDNRILALRPNWMIRGTLFPTNGSRMFYRTNVRYMSMRRGHDVLHDGCFWGKLEDVGTMQVRIAQTLNIYRSPEIVASKVQKLQRATKKKFIHANVCSHIVWLFPCFIPEKWNCGTGP